MLTNKGKYGLKAMVHLSALEKGQHALSSEIAARHGISKKFLDTILAELRTAGLVQAKKGKGGGYALSRPAGQIYVGQIVRALDGPLAPIACASQTSYRACDDCPDEAACAVRAMMLEVREAISQVLDNRTLSEMRLLVERDDTMLLYDI